MRMRTLIYFYWRRLCTHPVQEALAAFGIAVGVALFFSVQIANSSITAGSGQIVESIGGPANYQVLARDGEGFPESIVSQISALPGVKRAAAVYDQAGSVQGPNGRAVPVQVASGNAMLWLIDGLGSRLLESLENNKNFKHVGANAVLLPTATATRLGVPTEAFSSPISKPPMITVRLRGRATKVQVGAVLGPETVGALSGAIAVIAPLELAQRLSGSQGRVTGALVQAKPGQRAKVHRELLHLADGRLAVGPPNEDLALLHEATGPNTEATSFFAFVSALVGLLLAWNAMLLSAPERRRMIADLRIQGARPMALAKLLMFQAVCLGLAASAAGILGGYLLSRGVFHESPGYLAAAFPLGTQTVVTWQPVIFSLLGGVIATCLAAAPPLFDLRRTRAVDAVYSEVGEPGQALAPAWKYRLFFAALLLVIITGATLLVVPSAVMLATVGLALATLLAVPFCFSMILRAALRLAVANGKMNMLLMAVRASHATTLRCLALAATGAIAIFGVVVSEGAHADLLHGLDQDYAQYVGTAPIWVTNKGDELATDSFPQGELAKRIRAIPAVATVRDYQGGFLDVAGRRVWVIARSSQAGMIVSPSQIIEGDPQISLSRLRAGGWITLSAQLATALHAHLGGRVSLPTPSGPESYRLAATTSNLGWAGGAIVIGDQDYRRAWRAVSPTALEVTLRPGASSGRTKTAIQGVLGAGSGLRVQTSAQRSSQADALAREGLSRLTQIALMLTIAAALAMAAAMGASIWQRRPALASLRIQSFKPRQLRRVLLYESCLVLGSGCAVGLIAGIYGHFLSDQFLRLTTGFPAPFSPGAALMAQTLLIVVVASLAVLTPPGYVASKAPPRLALQEA
jgi:putative ABC transport system permease protein